jgi:hypothetical protein
VALGLGLVLGLHFSLLAGILAPTGNFLVLGLEHVDLIRDLAVVIGCVLVLRWLQGGAHAWLQARGDQGWPRSGYVIGRGIAVVLLGGWLVVLLVSSLEPQLVELQATPSAVPLLALAVTIGMWAYPLAAWAGPGRSGPGSPPAWAYLGDPDQPLPRPASTQQPLRAVSVGVVGAGIVWLASLLAIAVVRANPSLMTTVKTPALLAAQVIGAIVASRSSRATGASMAHGLLAAFVAGVLGSGVLLLGGPGPGAIGDHPSTSFLTGTVWIVDLGAVLALGGLVLTDALVSASTRPGRLRGLLVSALRDPDRVGARRWRPAAVIASGLIVVALVGWRFAVATPGAEPATGDCVRQGVSGIVIWTGCRSPDAFGRIIGVTDTSFDPVLEPNCPDQTDEFHVIWGSSRLACVRRLTPPHPGAPGGGGGILRAGDCVAPWSVGSIEVPCTSPHYGRLLAREGDRAKCPAKTMEVLQLHASTRSLACLDDLPVAGDCIMTERGSLVIGTVRVPCDHPPRPLIEGYPAERVVARVGDSKGCPAGSNWWSEEIYPSVRIVGLPHVLCLARLP